LDENELDENELDENELDENELDEHVEQDKPSGERLYNILDGER